MTKINGDEATKSVNFGYLDKETLARVVLLEINHNRS